MAVPGPLLPCCRSFLFSSDRILAALGTSLLLHSEALAPLCTSLDELSVSVSVGHGRLVLLQAAAALFVALAQQQGTRQQLLQPDVSQALVGSCLQVRSPHGCTFVFASGVLWCAKGTGNTQEQSVCAVCTRGRCHNKIVAVAPGRYITLFIWGC